MNFLSSQAQGAAKGGSGDFGLNIPVRMGVFTGAQSGKLSFTGDQKEASTTSYSIGVDFNVPIPPISTLFGIQGWYSGHSKTGNTIANSNLFVGAYLGYLGKADDLFLGAGVSTASIRFPDEVDPNTQTTLNKSLPCGFAGWRHYFKTKLTTGLGLTGYYCQSDQYEKTVNASTTTSSQVSEKISSSGGLFYFLITWGEERKIF